MKSIVGHRYVRKKHANGNYSKNGVVLVENRQNLDLKTYECYTTIPSHNLPNHENRDTHSGSYKHVYCPEIDNTIKRFLIYVFNFTL